MCNAFNLTAGSMCADKVEEGCNEYHRNGRTSTRGGTRARERDAQRPKSVRVLEGVAARRSMVGRSRRLPGRGGSGWGTLRGVLVEGSGARRTRRTRRRWHWCRRYFSRRVENERPRPFLCDALLALQQDARIFLDIDLPNLAYDDAREQLRTLVARQQAQRHGRDSLGGCLEASQARHRRWPPDVRGGQRTSLTTTQAFASFIATISLTDSQKLEVSTKRGASDRNLRSAFPASSNMPLRVAS